MPPSSTQIPSQLTPNPSFVHSYERRFLEISANKINPGRLYRYRSCDTPFFEQELERMLLKEEIYFPRQTQLNDPFDCQPVFEKGTTQKEYFKHIHPVITAIRTEMAREVSLINYTPEEMCASITLNIMSEKLSTVKHHYDIRIGKMIAEMFASLGVLSLTTDNNNLVMWSMYANRGNGICVALEGLRFDIGAKYDIAPVQAHYTTTRPIFNYWGAAALFLHMTSAAAQYVPEESQQWLLESLEQSRYAWTKHERWRYEDEYRLIAYQSGGEYLNMTPAKISALYIGDNVLQNTKNLILSIIGKCARPIPTYIAAVSNTKYAMTFSRIL